MGILAERPFEALFTGIIIEVSLYSISQDQLYHKPFVSCLLANNILNIRYTSFNTAATMQFKVIVTLLLSSTALASAYDAQPATITASAVAWSGSSDSSETNPDSSSTVVPHSILTALESAIPPSWYTDILQPTFQDSIWSEIQAGTMPAWYNSLPSSVKAWASSEGVYIDVFMGAEQTMLVGAASSNAPATGVPAHNTASTMSTAAATRTGASSTKKSAPSSSTSTGGAPIATGGVAAGIAGVAGILGLALAL